MRLECLASKKVFPIRHFSMSLSRSETKQKGWCCIASGGEGRFGWSCLEAWSTNEAVSFSVFVRKGMKFFKVHKNKFLKPNGVFFPRKDAVQAVMAAIWKSKTSSTFLALDISWPRQLLDQKSHFFRRNLNPKPPNLKTQTSSKFWQKKFQTKSQLSVLQTLGLCNKTGDT